MSHPLIPLISRCPSHITIPSLEWYNWAEAQLRTILNATTGSFCPRTLGAIQAVQQDRRALLASAARYRSASRGA